ncbi:MAG: TldD/PmbA family protein [Myxococcota bacterium]|nr:TldD/PmbA family protein [Myxococcota bacterium]
MIERERSQAVLEQALAEARADDVELALRSTRAATTRFAGNAITQNVETLRPGLAVTAWFGRRSGTASTDQLDPQSVREAVRRAEASARVAPEDPETLPTLGPQRYLEVPSFDPAVREFGPARRAEAARQMVEVARERGLSLSGAVTLREGSHALATRNGLRAYAAESAVTGSCTADAGTGSGWAAAGHRRPERVDFAALARRASEKALAARDPIEVPAGDWSVVLEPAALAELLQWITWSWNARDTYAGRTFLSGRVGERLLGENVTLRTRPREPDLMALPFGWHGLPTVEDTWIDRGRIVRFFHDRWTARRHGVPATGWPQGLALDGGAESPEALIGGTRRGLLVTRFWYIRSVDPMRLLLTGMTRDGTFLVDDGRVVGAVKNLRFNESPLRALSAVEAMTPAAPVSGRMLAPSARLSAFHFDSTTGF